MGLPLSIHDSEEQNIFLSMTKIKMNSLTLIILTSMKVAHGAGPRTAQKLFEQKPDVLITGNGPGGNAAMALQQGNIKIITGAGAMTAKEAYDAYKKGEL